MFLVALRIPNFYPEDEDTWKCLDDIAEILDEYSGSLVSSKRNGDCQELMFVSSTEEAVPQLLAEIRDILEVNEISKYDLYETSQTN